MLSYVVGYYDVLFLTSTEFDSWDSIDLPYQGMSLTTYQSKFVLVGGRDPYTPYRRKITNVLLTSITGRQWEPSLPPMPTKRYNVSSVSTRSPEVLVIAGGHNSNYEELDVVEALLGDKWVAIDPLPTPASSMPSTLHDGNLYFMKRGDRGQDGTVFTCSGTSVISSPSSNSSGSSSTGKTLWRQFQAPDELNSTIVSCSSRLVYINARGIVRGYSSKAQSWLTTRITGWQFGDGSIASTILSTGELLLAHESTGIKRGTVSGERTLMRLRYMYLCTVGLHLSELQLSKHFSQPNTQNPIVARANTNNLLAVPTH